MLIPSYTFSRELCISPWKLYISIHQIVYKHQKSENMSIFSYSLVSPSILLHFLMLPIFLSRFYCAKSCTGCEEYNNVQKKQWLTFMDLIFQWKQIYDKIISFVDSEFPILFIFSCYLSNQDVSCNNSTRKHFSFIILQVICKHYR